MRFPEFSGEWEKHILGEIGEPYIGLTYSPSDVVSSGGTIVLRSSNIRNGEIDYTDIVRVERKIKENIITHEDDLLICARNGSPRLIGKNALLKKEDSNQTFGAFMLIFRSKENHFVHQLLNTKVYYSQVSENLGARINQITTSNIKDFEFYFPKHKNERDKIACFLDLIDERIAIQSKVIEKLKSLMKGMNDALMDNPSWEKVQVCDFMDFYSTNSLSWEQLSYKDGLIKNLHYGLIHVGLPTVVDCKKTPLPYIQNDSIPSQYTNCKNGDVAFADASEDTAEVGKAIELDNIDDLDIICGLHTIHGRDVKSRTVMGFKGFAFNSTYFHDQIRRLAQGSKVYSINTDNIKSCFLYIPDIEEQKKNVAIMLCVQYKIAAEEQLFHLYENQKKHLLKQMFI